MTQLLRPGFQRRERAGTDHLALSPLRPGRCGGAATRASGKLEVSQFSQPHRKPSLAFLNRRTVFGNCQPRLML